MKSPFEADLSPSTWNCLVAVVTNTVLSSLLSRFPQYHGVKAQESWPKQTLVESSGWECQSITFISLMNQDDHSLVPRNPSLRLLMKKHSNYFPVAIFGSGKFVRMDIVVCISVACCFHDFLVGQATAALGEILSTGTSHLILSLCISSFH